MVTGYLQKLRICAGYMCNCWLLGKQLQRMRQRLYAILYLTTHLLLQPPATQQ